MNIFFLDENPEYAAKYHNDKHVVKMILESAQLLSTAHRFLDGELYYEKSINNRNLKRWKLNDQRENVLYKATHFNHPCSIWVRESFANYHWLYSLFLFLSEEYTYRFNKQHLSFLKLKDSLYNAPFNITKKEMTKVVLAMPEEYKKHDAVKAYREYYKIDKKHLLQYTNREHPYWLGE